VDAQPILFLKGAILKRKKSTFSNSVFRRDQHTVVFGPILCMKSQRIRPLIYSLIKSIKT